MIIFFCVCVYGATRGTKKTSVVSDIIFISVGKYFSVRREGEKKTSQVEMKEEGG